VIWDIWVITGKLRIVFPLGNFGLSEGFQIVYGEVLELEGEQEDVRRVSKKRMLTEEAEEETPSRSLNSPSRPNQMTVFWTSN